MCKVRIDPIALQLGGGCGCGCRDGEEGRQLKKYKQLEG